jgi:hypothetical protein
MIKAAQSDHEYNGRNCPPLEKLGSFINLPGPIDHRAMI